jgi:multicomponent Na+:H+ antiporter subunit E
MADDRATVEPSSHAPYPVARAFVMRAALLALLWWAVSEGRADSWWFGVPAALCASAASLHFSPATRTLRPWPALRLLIWFLGRSLLAGADVAVRALRPSMPLAPGFVRVRMRLVDAGARVLLADLLTLLPGTLASGFDDDTLLLHVLDERLPVSRQVRDLEERVAELLAVPLVDVPQRLADPPPALHGT